MRNRQKSASNKNDYKPRNPFYYPLRKKSHTLLPKETTSTEMPFLNTICFGQYKMRGQNQSDKTKNF